jgi:hypothetical protein
MSKPSLTRLLGHVISGFRLCKALRERGHQIRRLVVYVQAVPLRAVCAAQVRGRIQPDRQSPIWCWLVD